MADLIYGNAVAIDGGEVELITNIDGGEIELITNIDGGEIGTFMPLVPAYYDGETEVTPTEDTQILYTNDKMVMANIVVNPIPTNYGLITWDGTKIRVS